MSTERNLRLALQQLVEAVEYTPMGVRGIKAVANARAALKRDLETHNQLTTSPTLVGEVYRYGRDCKGTPWHGVHWSSSGVDLPPGTNLYVLNQPTES